MGMGLTRDAITDSHGEIINGVSSFGGRTRSYVPGVHQARSQQGEQGCSSRGEASAEDEGEGEGE